MSEYRAQTLREELANGITHGFGALAAFVGLGFLVVGPALHGDGFRAAGASVYGASLVAVYIASTVYHSFHHPDVKPVLQRIDRAAVYLFMAGTLSPFALDGHHGLGIFGPVWAGAGLGIAFETKFGRRFEVLSTVVYIGTILLQIAWSLPALAELPAGGLEWLIAGGVSYLVGVVFFWWTRLPYHHTIWHGFVLAGSACHFAAIWDRIGG